MSNFKPGDIVIGRTVGAKWKFIAKVDGMSYAVPVEASGDDADAVSFIGDLEGWTKAPEPFFEEGVGYWNIHSSKIFTVRHVHEMALGRVAVVQDINGVPSLLTEADYGNFEKV